MRWKKLEPRPDTYWKPWFAWYPVKIEDTGETVWLEWIWRHREYYTVRMEVLFVSTRYRSDVHWGGANLERKEGWPNFCILLASSNEPQPSPPQACMHLRGQPADMHLSVSRQSLGSHAVHHIRDIGGFCGNYRAELPFWGAEMTVTVENCRFCGKSHGLRCPEVKAIEYAEDGVTVKRVEFVTAADYLPVQSAQVPFLQSGPYPAGPWPNPVWGPTTTRGGAI